MWQVHRQFPWPPRRSTKEILGRDPSDHPGDFGWAGTESFMYGAGTDSVVAGVAVLVAFFVFALVILFFLPFVLFTAEAALAIVGVVLLFRPWKIVASTAGPPAERLEWQVKGWRGSRRGMTEVARELSAGVPAAPDGDP